MKSLQELGESLKSMALARPRAAIALALLAPSALAVSWKGVADEAPAQAAPVVRDEGAVGEDLLKAEVESLRALLAEHGREVAELRLALGRVGTEHVAGAPSSLGTGAFRAEPTEAEYLQRKPHLIDPDRVRVVPDRRSPEREPERRTTTLLLGANDSNGTALERIDRPEPPTGPESPRPPHGAPEIDPNLATAGLLLLAGGTLVLTGRQRAV